MAAEALETKCPMCFEAAGRVDLKLKGGTARAFDPTIILTFLLPLIQFLMKSCPDPEQVKKNAAKRGNFFLRAQIKRIAKRHLKRSKADDIQIGELVDSLMETAAEASVEEIEQAYLEASLLPATAGEE